MDVALLVILIADTKVSILKKGKVICHNAINISISSIFIKL